jgi:hypothetical protein
MDDSNDDNVDADDADDDDRDHHHCLDLDDNNEDEHDEDDQEVATVSQPQQLLRRCFHLSLVRRAAFVVAVAVPIHRGIHVIVTVDGADVQYR